MMPLQGKCTTFSSMVGLTSLSSNCCLALDKYRLLNVGRQWLGQVWVHWLLVFLVESPVQAARGVTSEGSTMLGSCHHLKIHVEFTNS